MINLLISESSILAISMAARTPAFPFHPRQLPIIWFMYMCTSVFSISQLQHWPTAPDNQIKSFAQYPFVRVGKKMGTKNIKKMGIMLKEGCPSWIFILARNTIKFRLIYGWHSKCREQTIEGKSIAKKKDQNKITQNQKKTSPKDRRLVYIPTSQNAPCCIFKEEK